MFQRGVRNPPARSFLASGIQDFFNQGVAIFIAKRQNVSGDLDQVGIERTVVPAAEGCTHLLMIHAKARLQQVKGFADELHVAVFDAVVHHLDEVSGAIAAKPVATGRAIRHFCRNGLENGFEVWPGCRRPAGHD